MFSVFNFNDYTVAKNITTIIIIHIMWYLIDTGFKDPYFNMAYDESLMGCIDSKDTVFLRFFNFSPVSVSLGYHQTVGDWLKELEKKGLMWVRRRTGGRAVIHCFDCTYSLVFHRSNPLIGGNIVNSYGKISVGFKSAFELLGVETESKRGVPKNKKGNREEMCFSSISLADLCWENKKIIGSAQYRFKDIVLQQGTIILKNSSEFPVGTGIATIEMAVGGEIELESFKNFVTEAFKRVFNVPFEKYKINPLNEKLLLKYSSPQWNFRGEI